MDTHPATRRQFLGTAAAVAVSPFLVAAPVPVVPPVPPPSPVPEPPLPPGVARQFGSARFRDLSAVRGQFTADSRWLVEFDALTCLCVGYEIATGRKVRFFAPRRDTDWSIVLWRVTTDGRLMVAERRGDDSRVRRFDLLTGAESAAKVGGAVVAFSADGRMAVLENQTKEGLRYTGVTTDTGELQWGARELAGVHRLDRSGRLTATGTRIGDTTTPLKLLDVTTGRTATIGPPPGGRGFDVVAAWSAADGRRLVAHIGASKEDRRLCTWDAHTGKLLGAFAIDEKEPVIGPTADGTGVFAADGGDWQLVVRDATDGKVVRRLPVADVGADGSAVSPDGKVLLLARPPGSSNTPDAPLRLIDPDTGELLPQSPDPPGPLTRVWFPSATVVGASHRPPDEHKIADEIRDFTVWDMPTGRGQRVVNPNRDDDVVNVGGGMSFESFSPDGRSMLRLVKGKLHSLDAGTVRSKGQYPGKALKDHWFWADANTVAMFDDTELVTWKPATAATTSTPLALDVKESVISSPRASADGTTVVTCVTAPGQAQYSYSLGWLDVRTGKVLTRREEATDGRGLRVSADGGRVAFRYVPKQVDPERWAPDESGGFVVRSRTGGRFRIPTEDEHKLYDLTGCGRSVVLQRAPEGDARGDPAIELWEVVSGGRRWKYPLDKRVADLRASPCGRFFATVRTDTPVYLWDIYGETSDPRPKPAADLPQLWDALNAHDAEKAFAAVRTLVQHPAEAVELFRAKLQPAKKPPPRWIAERIDRLSDRDFRTRHEAERELAAVADVIGPDLKKAANAGGATPEADERLTRLAAGSHRPPDYLRTTRSLEVLEYADGKAATDLLAKLSGGAEGAFLTREASAALARRRRRG